MASQWLKNLSHKAAHVRMLSPVYDRSLGRLDDPLHFSSFPIEIIDGDVGRGRWLASGKLEIASHRIPLDIDDWLIDSPHDGGIFFNTLHGFGFLSDLKALGGHEARQAARLITTKWLDQFHHYNPNIWNPALSAQRLVSWMASYGFAYETASDEFIYNLHNSFYRQFNHLDYILSNPMPMDHYDRMTILWALILVQCHCDTVYDDIRINSYLLLLKGVIGDLINNEGGVIDRKPLNALELFKMILMLRHSLQHRQKQSPLWLGSAIDKLSFYISNTTHSDKDFPRFQGCSVTDKKIIEKLLRTSGTKIRRLDQNLQQSGYTTLRKGRTSLIIDHGLSGGSVIAPMAMELSYGMNRIVTSCGTHYLDDNWQDAFQQMAAYSGVDMNGHQPTINDEKIKTSLEKMNGDVLFVGAHDGYRHDCHITHTRRIYMDKTGEDIRGEDILIRDLAVTPIPATIRFHLHASVRASLIDQASGVLIKLPNGVGWKFHCDNKLTLDLQDSVTCCDGFKIDKTMQITVSFQLNGLNDTIKWAFHKI